MTTTYSNTSCNSENIVACSQLVARGCCMHVFLVGFHSTPSTEGETLFELVKDVFRKLGLSLEKVVAECFDGASNMSGVHRGLAAQDESMFTMSDLYSLLWTST